MDYKQTPKSVGVDGPESDFIFKTNKAKLLIKIILWSKLKNEIYSSENTHGNNIFY